MSVLSRLGALVALLVFRAWNAFVALNADMPSRRAWGFCDSLGFGWALTIGSGAFGILGARMAFCLRFFMRLMFGFDGPPSVYLWGFDARLDSPTLMPTTARCSLAMPTEEEKRRGFSIKNYPRQLFVWMCSL